MQATEWLLGKPTHATHSVVSVLSMSHDELELHHDWIQWAFPLPEASAFNYSAPIALPNELAKQGADVQTSETVDMLFNMFMAFLNDHKDWYTGPDHNWLRITRVIRCQMLRGKEDDARKLYEFACSKCSHLLQTVHAAHIQKSMFHWNAAINSMGSY